MSGYLIATVLAEECAASTSNPTEHYQFMVLLSQVILEINLYNLNIIYIGNSVTIYLIIILLSPS